MDNKLCYCFCVLFPGVAGKGCTSIAGPGPLAFVALVPAHCMCAIGCDGGGDEGLPSVHETLAQPLNRIGLLYGIKKADMVKCQLKW